jgi:hypothetical protein
MRTLDTADVTTTVTPTSLPRRVRAMVRLHLANPMTPIYMPLMILSFIFVANYAIWQLVASAGNGDAVGNMNNGGVGFVVIYMMVIAVQTMNSTFPFAMGYGVTRRDFYLGSAAFFVLLAVGYAALLAVLGVVERATDGWGMGAQFFAPLFVGDIGGHGWFYLHLTLLLFFFFLGASTAGVYVRWRANGMYVFFGSLVVAVIATIWLIIQTDSGDAIVDFVTDAGLFGMLTWSLVVSAALSLVGYRLIRRATPRA